MKRLIPILVLCLIVFQGCGTTTQTDKNTTATNSTALRIACVGDSLTDGYKLSDPVNESYPGQLTKLVSEGTVVKNFGIFNKTVLKESNAPYWNSSEYSNSLAFNPEIVVLMFGSNDIKDVNWGNKASFIRDYNALIKSYQTLSSHPRVYICLPLPSFTSKYGMSDNRIVHELIPKIKEVAQQNSVTLIDLHTPFAGKEHLFIDKIHPTTDGTKKMAEIVYTYIY